MLLKLRTSCLGVLGRQWIRWRVWLCCARSGDADSVTLPVRTYYSSSWSNRLLLWHDGDWYRERWHWCLSTVHIQLSWEVLRPYDHPTLRTGTTCVRFGSSILLCSWKTDTTDVMLVYTVVHVEQSTMNDDASLLRSHVCWVTGRPLRNPGLTRLLHSGIRILCLGAAFLGRSAKVCWWWVSDLMDLTLYFGCSTKTP